MDIRASAAVQPRVSIVLPSFNRLKFLRSAVDSVFAQSFTGWELIVADDGSDEETCDYLDTLVGPAGVKVLRLPHSGNPGAVRNAACRVAGAEYIAFLDSDDVWHPQKLALQVASLDSHPDRGWGDTAFAAIDEAGNLLTGERARRWPASEGWILEGLIKMKSVIAIPTVMVRRQLLERSGGFDTGQRMCEDYDLWLRLAGLSEIDGVHETLVFVRVHQEHFHRYPAVFEDRSRALEKLLRNGLDRPVLALLRRERARAAADLARSQAVLGGRLAALCTLAKSSQYSWTFRDWWIRGAYSAARAVAPAGILKIARAVARRRRNH
jgi:glycosyltransferase involved in cell wall biosynthesis